MSLITRNNYEAYLLDYYEENLSPQLTTDLILFLEQNPELEEGLDSFEIHELSPLGITLPDKSKLLIDESLINLENYEDFIIAEIEGLNSDKVSKELMSYLDKNSILHKKFLMYQSTKLIGVHTSFDAKETLVKKERRIIPLYWLSSAAAILILFLLNIFIGSEKPQYEPYARFDEVFFEKYEDKNSPEFYLFDDNHQKLSRVEKKNSRKKISEEIKENGDSLQILLIKNHEHDLASLSKSIEVIDTSETIEVEQENLVKEDQLLLAENSVKIIYLDHVLDSKPSVSEKKRMTKIEVLGKAIKQQVKVKVLNKGRDKFLLLANSKPTNFFKGRNKK